ncbi:MAG: ExbD/TolR family protein [Chitinophagaceae bacterium]
MAEVDTSGGGHKKGPGVKKGKKLSTRVDLTPMCDLGFLLITFFIFTTTMSQPTAMRLTMPDDRDQKTNTNIKQSGALTILLGKDHNVFYYEGELSPDASNFKSSNFKDIRNEIISKKRNSNDKDFFVTIKPTDESTYKDVVNILDEMTINVVKRYALVNEVAPIELQLVQRTEGEPVTPIATTPAAPAK